MLAIRWFSVVGLLGMALGVAPAAQAGVQLYFGKWVAQSFGNDRTVVGKGGAVESDAWSVLGIPVGNLCNVDQPKCVFGQTGATKSPGQKAAPLNANVFDPLAKFCRPYSDWGLVTMNGSPVPRPVKGGTATTGGVFGRPVPPLYRNPAHFTATTYNGAGKSTFCNDETTVMGGLATMNALTTFDPRQGVGMKGAPLTGWGVAVTSVTSGVDKPAFTFPAAPPNPTTPLLGGVRRTTTGSFSDFFPYLYSYTYARMRNDQGSFSKDYGNFTKSAAYTQRTFPYKIGINTVAKVVIKKGTRNFGGVMRLLGQMTTKVCYFLNQGCLLGTNDWKYDLVGTSGGVTVNGIVQPVVIAYDAVYYHTELMIESVIMAIGQRFRWTTGTVTVTATGRGPNNTIEKRHGFDNRGEDGRDPGVGTVQLVSPIITKWLQPATNFETAGIGIMRIIFVPEPQSWLMLVAGFSLLGVLYRIRGR